MEGQGGTQAGDRASVLRRVEQFISAERVREFLGKLRDAYRPHFKQAELAGEVCSAALGVLNDTPGFEQFASIFEDDAKCVSMLISKNWGAQGDEGARIVIQKAIALVSETGAGD